jgi:hypothetical protein
MRRIAVAGVGLALAAPFYLLLIDTTDLPELYVMGGVALLAALGFVISREQGLAEAALQPRWLLGAWRAMARVPLDIVRVGAEAIAQLAQFRRTRGEFRVVPFRAGDGPDGLGRIALTESLGSFAPNTIVIGVDPEAQLLLVHQLRRAEGREEIDVLGLG